jgi:hypothetical protein
MISTVLVSTVPVSTVLSTVASATGGFISFQASRYCSKRDFFDPGTTQTILRFSTTLATVQPSWPPYNGAYATVEERPFMAASVQAEDPSELQLDNAFALKLNSECDLQSLSENQLWMRCSIPFTKFSNPAPSRWTQPSAASPRKDSTRFSIALSLLVNGGVKQRINPSVSLRSVSATSQTEVEFPSFPKPREGWGSLCRGGFGNL